MAEIKNKEYDFLRKEIEFYLEKQNSMINWIYISVTAILAIALDKQNVSICILIYCIVIPTFFVDQEYNIGILKIGAYLNVFYDDYKWEKRLHIINESNSTAKKINRLSFSHSIPYIFMGVLSCILAWIIYANINAEKSFDTLWELICCILITFITFIFLLFVFHRKVMMKLKIFILKSGKNCAEMKKIMVKKF